MISLKFIKKKRRKETLILMLLNWVNFSEIETKKTMNQEGVNGSNQIISVLSEYLFVNAFKIINSIRNKF